MVSVVEREIRRPPKRAELAALEGCPVRFTYIFDQRDRAILQFVEQFRTQGVVAKDVRQEYGARVRRDLRQDLLVVHAEGARINIDKHWLKAAVKHGGDVRNPCQWRHE